MTIALGVHVTMFTCLALLSSAVAFLRNAVLAIIPGRSIKLPYIFVMIACPTILVPPHLDPNSSLLSVFLLCGHPVLPYPPKNICLIIFKNFLQFGLMPSILPFQIISGRQLPLDDFRNLTMSLFTLNLCQF